MPDLSDSLPSTPTPTICPATASPTEPPSPSTPTFLPVHDPTSGCRSPELPSSLTVLHDGSPSHDPTSPCLSPESIPHIILPRRCRTVPISPIELPVPRPPASTTSSVPISPIELPVPYASASATSPVHSCSPTPVHDPALCEFTSPVAFSTPPCAPSSSDSSPVSAPAPACAPASAPDLALALAPPAVAWPTPTSPYPTSPILALEAPAPGPALASDLDPDPARASRSRDGSPYCRVRCPFCHKWYRGPRYLQKHLNNQHKAVPTSGEGTGVLRARRSRSR